MRSAASSFATGALIVVMALYTGVVCAKTSQVLDLPMSFSNRLLLNRATIYGQERVETMLLVDSTGMSRTRALIAKLGGRILYEIPAIQYIRVDLPIAKFSTLVADPSVVSYQVSSNATMIWDEDGITEHLADMYRGYEAQPLVAATSNRGPGTELERQLAALPYLTVPQSRDAGYTADEETGVRYWRQAHPTWDGRGVTIALIESALLEFDHPTLRDAKDGQGRPTRKVELVDTLQAPDPPKGDLTRVRMDTLVQSSTTWVEVSGRTYILPHAGTFRFGSYPVAAGGNVKQEFAVLWDETTGEIIVDTDGDADFRNERSMRDFNDRGDVGSLKVTQPTSRAVSFVVSKARESNVLQIYTARGGHHAMTASVAAGSMTTDGLAFGVAPNAKLLIVRNQDEHNRGSDIIEGYASIASRPDVDVISDSRIVTFMPEIADSFFGLAFRRLAAAYGKPIFHSAGNGFPAVGSASAMDGVFSVGGSIDPSTYSSIFGKGRIQRTINFNGSLEGPGADGGFKPDFLAPENRIAADICTHASITYLPRNAPTVKMPPCYQISGGTSASSPYAAGLAALLISAARQSGMAISADSLGRSLREGAKFLQGVPAHAQGSGLVNVDAAWLELQRKSSPQRIRVRGPIVHPMTRYATTPGQGPGLFEMGGWAPGASGTRTLTITREAGSTAARRFYPRWTGNDGTFGALGSVQLALNKEVQVPILIRPKSYGPHSAILDLIDTVTGEVASRSMVTIVVPRVIPESEGSTVSMSGTVPLMESETQYVDVIPGTSALRIDVDVKKGSLSAWLLNSDPTSGVPNRPLFPSRLALPAGRYTWVVPYPSGGTWLLSLTNDSAWRGADPSLASTTDAQYTVSFSTLKAGLDSTGPDGRLTLTARNEGAALGVPVVDVYPSKLTSTKADFLPSGLPNQFPLEIPAGSGVVRITSKSELHSSDYELSLYDCTSGQCFYWDYAGTAASEQLLIVHNPKPGKWVVAVNAAPSLVGRGGFTLSTLIGAAAERSPLTLGLPWHKLVDGQATRVDPLESPLNEMPVLYCELVDSDLQGQETRRMMRVAENATDPRQKVAANPVAIAAATFQLNRGAKMRSTASDIRNGTKSAGSAL